MMGNTIYDRIISFYYTKKSINRIQPMGTMKGCAKLQGYPIVHISVWTEVVDQATKSEIQNKQTSI